MMKIAVSTATILLLLGTSALAQEQGKKRDDTLDKAGEIASQPRGDSQSRRASPSRPGS